MVTIRHDQPIPVSGTTPRHYPIYSQKINNLKKLEAWCTIIRQATPTPSRADIEMTMLVIATAKPLGIAVHDHIIIGKKGYSCMKGLLLI
jgi:DNA repair protein RadC